MKRKKIVEQMDNDTGLRKKEYHPMAAIFSAILGHRKPICKLT